MTKQSVMRSYLRLSLINIKRIDSNLGENDLHRTDIEFIRGAELIIEAGGVINPLVVKRTTKDVYKGRYELVNGFFEYFCAVRAMAIDPSLECIQAWVCGLTNTTTLENQLALFREDDNYEDDFFALDFELVGNDPDDDLEDFIQRSIADGTIKDCFAAADRFCQQYPAGEDRNNAIAELESIKERASGDRTYQSKLDAFFAETGGIYE